MKKNTKIKTDKGINHLREYYKKKFGEELKPMDVDDLKWYFPFYKKMIETFIDNASDSIKELQNELRPTQAVKFKAESIN